VVPYLRSAEPINKVIWSVYYMKPLNDLIGRIIGKETKCGIYKLTNTKNKKVYIGQAVSVSDRWKQHVKRGVGAETPTRNKLYPEMQEYGPELFTFELLEECPKDQLNAREKYWIEYFDSCTWGYNGNTGVGEK
jgi:group I intron endonuclease